MMPWEKEGQKREFHESASLSVPVFSHDELSERRWILRNQAWGNRMCLATLLGSCSLNIMAKSDFFIFFMSFEKS
jgi:hypothetical protein